MMHQVLKACPFCGGRPTIRLGTQRQSCIIICDECGARLESNESYELCGEQWNNRNKMDDAERTKLLQKVVDRLDAHLKALPGPIECGLSDNYKEFILETKLEA